MHFRGGQKATFLPVEGKVLLSTWSILTYFLAFILTFSVCGVMFRVCRKKTSKSHEGPEGIIIIV